MATDIALADSGLPIKNGTIVVGATEGGYYFTIDTYVISIPNIEDIEIKYDYRFDDYNYYFAGGSGGIASGNLVGW